MKFQFEVNNKNYVATVIYSKGNGVTIPRAYYLNVMSGVIINKHVTDLNPLGYNHCTEILPVSRKSKKRTQQAGQNYQSALKNEIKDIKEHDKKAAFEATL